MNHSQWKRGFVVLVAALGVAMPAFAERGNDVDEAVTKWFEQSAMEELREISAAARVIEGEQALALSKPQFGAVFRVHTWTRAFLAGDERAAATEAIDQWAAPLFDEGRVVGTVVAWRDPQLGGEVALAYFDEDREAGLALAELEEKTHLVLDAPLSSYFTISGDRVRAISGAAKRELEGEQELLGYQRVLVERYAGAEQYDPAEGYAGGGATVPVLAASAGLNPTLPVAAGSALALVGPVLLVIDGRRRRRAAL